ncbi:MAG: EF-P beta-lysylation protein EpmB [Planctomycetota bacterium]|nr:EF-P beta-lysylation protein EpmB [Planctomycetota bacterium]MDA1165138.1 EF-P beta-lysylation protein EpmB [Planctomycetota bacterium]
MSASGLGLWQVSGVQTDWHRSLAQAIRDPAELLRRLELGHMADRYSNGAASEFALLVPRSFLARMQIGDASDPLLRQVLPVDDELQPVSGFVVDAVSDASFRTAPGLLHKYSGRALMIAAGSCAVNCRYCFRRHYPYGDEPRRLDDWEPALAQLRADSSISELLLSGGDPLMLTDLRLSQLVDRVEDVPHLKRLRIHTRLPIVLPDRVTDELLRILKESRLTPVVVVHANHSNEVVADCADALRRLVRAGITVLNQSVLLRKVNDSVDALAGLSESLINLGVIPYYLHQLDRVAGAAHFEVDPAVGRRLIRELRARVPGYAVPRYVQEIAGEAHKTVIE